MDELLETRGFARKNSDGRNADRRLANRCIDRFQRLPTFQSRRFDAARRFATEQQRGYTAEARKWSRHITGLITIFRIYNAERPYVLDSKRRDVGAVDPARLERSPSVRHLRVLARLCRRTIFMSAAPRQHN